MFGESFKYLLLSSLNYNKYTILKLKVIKYRQFTNFVKISTSNAYFKKNRHQDFYIAIKLTYDEPNF